MENENDTKNKDLLKDVIDSKIQVMLIFGDETTYTTKGVMWFNEKDQYVINGYIFEYDDISDFCYTDDNNSEGEIYLLTNIKEVY